MKVYVLMRMNVIDVEVDAIYSTKELALQACESYTKHETNTKTQWASTCWISETGWKYWIDEFELDAG